MSESGWQLAGESTNQQSRRKGRKENEREEEKKETRQAGATRREDRRDRTVAAREKGSSDKADEEARPCVRQEEGPLTRHRVKQTRFAVVGERGQREQKTKSVTEKLREEIERVRAQLREEREGREKTQRQAKRQKLRAEQLVVDWNKERDTVSMLRKHIQTIDRELAEERQRSVYSAETWWERMLTVKDVLVRDPNRKTAMRGEQVKEDTLMDMEDRKLNMICVFEEEARVNRQFVELAGELCRRRQREAGQIEEDGDISKIT